MIIIKLILRNTYILITNFNIFSLLIYFISIIITKNFFLSFFNDNDISCNLFHSFNYIYNSIILFDDNIF